MNTYEEKALKGLIDAFSPMISPEEISSAYFVARKDADAAGLLLCNKLGASTDLYRRCVPEGDDVTDNLPSKSSSHDMPLKPSQTNGNSKSSKLKLPPASLGTMSNFLGKDYMSIKPSESGFYEATKPLKLDPEFLPMSELLVGKDPMETKSNQMHKEMEDFLFKMLGEGFKLDRHVIQDVLGKCGYDMQEGMERLFYHSTSNLERRKILQKESSLKYKDSYSMAGVGLQQKKIQHTERSSGIHRDSSKDDEEFRRKLYRKNQEKEVLASLFSSTGKLEDLMSTAAEKSEAPSLVVESAEKLAESTEKLTLVDESNMADSKLEKHEEYEEGSYQALRKAVLEYRETMKEYYAAAIEAFQMGDKIRANKLLEKGNFFQKKAREANDVSSEKIFETSDTVDAQDLITLDLDLHEYEPREATRLLKQHLSSLAGHPAFQYLKVIIETDDEDSSKGARRQRILRLLERNSLRTEEGTAGTILIPLESINRQSLSFVKG